MADIRPAQLPLVRTQSAPAPASDARAAAQRAAFFQAALTGKVETPAPHLAPSARAPDLTIQMPTEAPPKILRPGSLVNIVV
jgi:hypothetical protein